MVPLVLHIYRYSQTFSNGLSNAHDAVAAFRAFNPQVFGEWVDNVDMCGLSNDMDHVALLSRKFSFLYSL